MFKSEKKNNIQKLIREIMQAYNVSRQLCDVAGEIFFYCELCGRSPSITPGRWEPAPARTHVHTHTRLSIRTGLSQTLVLQM